MLASGLAFQMPIFILALVRLRILTAARLRRNRRVGIVSMLLFAILLPTVDPVSLALEFLPLIFLFEFSIWLASFMEKRWDIVDERSRWSGRVRVLSADWVLPVEGEPIENGAVAIEDGRIAAVGTVDELGAGEHFAEAAIIPGFVNAHSHLEYAVYAGFGDGLSFAPWLATHIERKARIDRADGGDRAAGRRPVPGVRNHDNRRRGLHGCCGARLQRARPAGDRLPRGFRPRAGRGVAAIRGEGRIRQLGRLRSGTDRRLAARSLHVLDRGVRRLP